MSTFFRVLALVWVAAAVGSPLAAQASLRGSRPSVDRMYNQAVAHKLKFHRNAGSVRKAAQDGVLVRLGGNSDYQLASVRYPNVLPSTRVFVQRLADQYRDVCGERMVVTSGVRPESFRLVNGNPKSVHPTGMAVDLRRPRKSKCLNWLRKTLVSVEGEGAIEATEERNPAHFHVAVFPGPYTRYVAKRGGKTDVNPTLATASTPKTTQTSEAATRYRVRRGDSLWSIARRHGISVQQLRRANGDRSSRIRPGQTLTIPADR